MPSDYVGFDKDIPAVDKTAINAQQTARNAALAQYVQAVLAALQGKVPGATLATQPGERNADYQAPDTYMLANPEGQQYALTLNHYDTMRDPAAAAKQAMSSWQWEKENAAAQPSGQSAVSGAATGGLSGSPAASVSSPGGQPGAPASVPGAAGSAPNKLHLGDLLQKLSVKQGPTLADLIRSNFGVR